MNKKLTIKIWLYGEVNFWNASLSQVYIDDKNDLKEIYCLTDKANAAGKIDEWVAMARKS